MPLPTYFPVVRYRLQFVTEQPLELPDYAGSALRGVFGHALREAACVTGRSDCAACPLYRSCPYPAIFEPPPPLNYSRRTLSDIAPTFVVEPPPWGQSRYDRGSSFEFSTVLIGPALAQLPLVLLAWRQALQRGLGPAAGTAQLQQVWADGDAEPLLAQPGGRLRPHVQSLPLPAPDAAPTSVSLHLSTPLRLKRDGQILGVAQLAPRDLLMALLRRTAHLAELHLGSPLAVDFAALNAHASSIRGEHDLLWRDWSRHSTRQQQHMVLGGAVGRWTLHGDLSPFWPLLHLGQWLHVGKNASFGLGQYRLEHPPESPP